MLSILIPVYNYDVRRLVSDLLSQIILINDPVEICLLNDGSDNQWMSSLEEVGRLDNVSLQSFSQNQGRVASRKKLAELAQYDYLLFIDCDAEIVSDTFISSYLDSINNDVDAQVIAGGHIYQNEIPEEKYRLHWKYGRQVEVRSLSQRCRYPYTSFSTFNFCIEKWVYLNYFSEIKIEGYGHEDTLIGNVMAGYAVTIEHIDNPLLHAGLKDNDRFLLDTSRAVENAYLISKEYDDLSIKVIDVSNKLKTFGLSRIVLFALNKFENRILVNLKSVDPSLYYLQLYKLKTLLQLEAKC